MPTAFQSASARRQFVRRSTCAVLLAAFVVTATGRPLPAGNQPGRTKTSTELFPCAKSSCGCRTANQCWSSCCCHSLAERIAWARQNGIRPPDFVLAQAKAAGIEFSCCAAVKVKKTRTSCEVHLAAASKKVVRSCCSNREVSSTEESNATRVIGWQSLKCKGHSMNWLAAVPTLIVVRPGHANDLHPSSWLAPTASDHSAGTADRPALPPPEVA